MAVRLGRNAQCDVPFAEEAGLEGAHGSINGRQPCIAVDDDSAEHEHRVVWVDDVKVVAAGLVEEEVLHAADGSAHYRLWAE